VFPDEKIQSAIVAAATIFEAKVKEKIEQYHKTIASNARLIPTERRVELEMHI
jgi:hypothetical protein